ncbi:MAG: tetratricopeptide repeat protein [Alphaproteobacteria bacterium]
MSHRIWLIVVVSALLSACSGIRGSGGDPSLVAGDDRKGLFTLVPKSEKPLAKAKLHFKNEDYGLAEKYFRQAVEENSNQTVAWLGLAASYDRLRRFDLAARAYKVVVKQMGYTATVHNNLGYHHYLQGHLKKARKHFNEALAKDPGNPYVLNNLEMLDSPSA